MPTLMSVARCILPTLIGINVFYTVVIARNVTSGSTPYSLQSIPISIKDNTTQNLQLVANGDFKWNANVTAVGDVTSWFADCNDTPAFTQSDGVAQATVAGDVLTIDVDASKIAGFTTNGPGTLTLRPPTGALTGGKTAYTPTGTYVGGYTIPKLNVFSNIIGTVYTHAKSTLKEQYHQTVEYAAGTDAKLWLELPGLDDFRIGSDNATVTFLPGDGYYTSEYIFNATSLTTPFVNGKTSYQLQQGDITLNTDGYLIKNNDSGREWSCLGGDGHGNYIYNLEVAGITYNGLPVAAQKFRVHVYIYGYNYGFNSTSDADVKYGNGTFILPTIAPLSSKVSNPPQPASTPIYTWVGAGDKPILVDAKADDFYITWPTGVDASDLEACDVTVSLKSPRGDTLQLNAGEAFVISTSTSETQISVTYLNWAFEPVYTTLNITVDSAALKGSSLPAASLTATYDISSVYVYLTQQGGGGTTTDGTVTAYSFYGLANLDNVQQISTPANYTLGTTINGTDVYYAESSNGTGILVDSLEAASTYDGNGLDDENIQLLGNVLYVTTRVNATANKTIAGEPVTFTKAYEGGSTLTPSQVESYLFAAPGYIIPPLLDTAELAGIDADEFNNTWIYHEKWAWQPRIQIGFHGIDIEPYTGKFEWTLALGDSQQFYTSAWQGFSEAAAADVTWSLIGNESANTTLSSTGLFTFADDETADSVAVIVTSNIDHSYNGKGTINVSPAGVALAV